MKYPAISLFCSTVMLFSATANAQPQAQLKDIISLKAACAEIAQEDSLPENEIPSFLLDCVNDQLNERGYERVEYLEGVTPNESGAADTDNPSTEALENQKSLVEALSEENTLPEEVNQ
ncbi:MULTISPECIES: hypothetical protein [Pseudomonadati]|uniref:DUF5330 domain-containing protein n=1 Tax=Shewanella aestuarii TaxID=1028752 RepID=A0ABT0KZH0_9GAMM|nr:hypothetical protein [Shewanella aestuarii]MCL1116864.1 hypothetical protein [Shewanella aestuarii]GGN73602.1 hypothetical protein GCM10009193_11760 [Shewanella aestuarii]